MSAKKKRRGRPSLPRDERRVIPLHILLTPKEYRTLKRAAAAEDTSMSSWVRRWILEGLGRSGG